MRFKAILEYKGDSFCGWQKQSNCKSVQGVVESVLKILNKNCSVDVFCAGKTDSGVHAKGQVIHFNMDHDWDHYLLKRALNGNFRSDELSVLSVEKVDDSFHARLSALERSYRYTLFNRESASPIMSNVSWHIRHKLDTAIMLEASQLLHGTHDFSAFRAAGCQSLNPVKTLNKIDIFRFSDEIIYIDISARSFLYKQVRIIVGTLCAIGLGRSEKSIITDMLAFGKRNIGGVTAPPCGLCFMDVKY